MSAGGDVQRLGGDRGTSHALVAAARAAGVRDPRVLASLADVPRAAYVPPASVEQADVDRPIAIGGGQVTTQPSLLAAMVEALALGGGERVLEVGAGLGYQTAILARLAREVWAVERRPGARRCSGEQPRGTGGGERARRAR